MIYQTIISLNLCFFILLISTIFSSKLSSDKKIDVGFIFLIFSTLPIFIGGFICSIIILNLNLNLNFYTNINLLVSNIILTFYLFKKSKINLKKIFKLNLKSEFKKFDKIIISIFFFLLFLIAITPVTDADSILYHLNFAKDFFNKFPYNANLLNSLIGYTEFFNILPFFYGSTNFVTIHSFISFIILFFWILKNQNIVKNKKFLIYLIISCPVLFYCFDSEKPFLIAIFLIIYVLLDYFTAKNTKIFIKYFILALLPLVKLNFIIPSTLLIIYFLFLDHQKKIRINTIIKVMFISFITYLPLLTFKLINFQNPFAPFLYEFFPSEFSNIGINLLLDAKTYVHGSSSINETKSLIQLLNIFVNINKIYDTIGIGIIIILLFFITNIKKFNNKILIFLLLALIVNLIATPYSPRFFLQMYLIICIFLLNSNNKMITLKNDLFLVVLKIQLVFVTLMMTVFCYININIFLKDDMKKAIHSYDKASKLNKIFSKNQKVITEASIFNNFIHMPIYNLSYSMNSTDVNNFKNKILKEKFEYYISDIEIKKFFTSKQNIRLLNPLFYCFSLKDKINIKIGNKTNYFKEIFFKIDVPERDLYIYQKKKC